MNPPNPKPLISRRRIQKRTAELGIEISAYYLGRPLLVTAVCNGALLFAADLIRNITVPMQFDTLAVNSYIGDQSSGKIRFRSQPKLDPSSMHLLLLDDIVDTGLTISKIIEYYQKFKPLSIKTCALLNKPAGRQVAVQTDWIGFDIPDKFVVGYGLDCNEFLRNIPYIGTL
ncbi:MAG: hypoxanthine phosphoribosyltransferase [Lentisphaerota bacterium]